MFSSSKEVFTERAALVCLASPKEDKVIIQYRMEELGRLVETAGAKPVLHLIQKRTRPDTAYCIGKGKVEELSSAVQEEAIDLVVFEGELSPVQLRNLDEALESKVLDRTAVILDIFAGRARSREGKLQVELAQMQYLLPRLTGYGRVLSRLGGGIGTRGPGETKLETDRRRIRKRISDVKKEIEGVKKHRLLHRSRRQKKNLFLVSLVGYTNAGKSTLLNALSGAKVLSEDKLFATLDPTVRRVPLRNKGFFLLADTVGFIRNLPPLVKEAFEATLEEIAVANLVLHVADLSHPGWEEQVVVVRKTLMEIFAGSYEELMVFNKIDCLPLLPEMKARLQREYPGCCFTSALKGDGLAGILKAIEGKMN